MLLSARDRPTDIPNPLSQKPLPDILSNFRRSSIPSSIAQPAHSTPRLPLASLGSLSTAQSLENMSPTPSSSASSLNYPQQDDSDTHHLRYHIGRPIVDTRTADDEDTQSRNPIAPQSTAGTSTSRKDNVPGGLPLKASDSSSAVHLRAPSPMSPTNITSSALQFQNNVDSDTNRPNPAYLTNGDLYSNLATFSFGCPRSPSRGSSSSLYDADIEVSEMISPLTPMVRRPSADRTPRPSVSGQSPGKQPCRHPAQPNTGKRSRDPSSSTSRPHISTEYHSPNSSRGDVDESEGPVDFDYRRPRGRAMSDAVSRHTFGGRNIRGRAGSPSASASSSRSGSRSSARSGLEFSSEDEVELDYDSAHGTYTQAGLGIDLDASGEYIDPMVEGRRGSLPMAIPGTSGDHTFNDDDGSRIREDSLVTLRRPSRSLDDDLMSNLGGIGVGFGDATTPKSEPHSRGDWRSLEAQHLQQQDQTQQRDDVYDGLNLAYILDRPDGTTGSRRASLAPSYVQTVSRTLPSRQSSGFKAGGWGAGLAWNATRRRSSTTTTGTANDDAFASHVKRFDGEYDQMASEWSFKKEKADGPGLNTNVAWSKRNREGTPTDEKERAKRRATMVPGAQELWRNSLVGRFKVDRLALKSRSQDPRKPPQQRLNVKHIPDPFSKGNTSGGPSSVVHKHSKAAAFSLFRHYGLLARSTTLSPGSPLPSAAAASRPSTSVSGAIMLAPKKVQEQYTSTKTTSKLTTHGLLGDEDRPEQPGRSSRPTSSGAQQAPSAVRREKEKKAKEQNAKEKKKQEKDEKKVKAKNVHQKRADLTESAESSSTAFSAQTDTTGSGSTKVDGSEGKQRRHSAHHTRQVLTTISVPQPSSSSSNASTAISSSAIKRYSSFEIPRADSMSHAGPSTRVFDDPLSKPADRISEYTDNTPMDNTEDTDDEPHLPVTRTPHAEAFATLDPNVIEYVRSKAGGRVIVEGHSVHWSKRWIPGFVRPTKTSNPPISPAGTSSAALEATYHPPWMTIAGRKVQENNELLIRNLNDSFKDVGLLHSTFKPSKSTTKSSRKNKTGPNLFMEIPDDALYMLLPLWAGETDKISMPSLPAPSSDLIPMDQRQYLLVYYVPFEQCHKEKSQELMKKKTKSSLSSPESSLDSVDSRIVMLSAFRVSARLVGYDELRGSGVRLPSSGLTVTGPLWEAQYSPPTGLSAEHHDDVVVAACYGREKGFEFLPDGLFKLGLCVLSPEPGGLEPRVLLSSIGRAVVEMIWLGCMALTSFGTA